MNQTAAAENKNEPHCRYGPGGSGEFGFPAGGKRHMISYILLYSKNLEVAQKIQAKFYGF